jgi:hypothetical protein
MQQRLAASVILLQALIYIIKSWSISSNMPWFKMNFMAFCIICTIFSEYCFDENGGVTGRLLIEQLLIRGQNVKAIVRSSKILPESLREDPQLSVIHASISELSDSEIAKHFDGCDAEGGDAGNL